MMPLAIRPGPAPMPRRRVLALGLAAAALAARPALAAPERSLIDTAASRVDFEADYGRQIIAGAGPGLRRGCAGGAPGLRQGCLPAAGQGC